jgi:hypothetical protein
VIKYNRNQFSDKALQDEKFLFKGSLVPQMSEQNVEIKMILENRHYQP